jgi:hypothetical protein
MTRKRKGQPKRMIDNFSLALTHGLMMIVALRILMRRELDHELAPGEKEPVKRDWLGRRA